MQAIIDITIQLAYIAMGSFMIYMGLRSFKSIQSAKKFGTMLFWVILGVIFILGETLPSALVGLLLVVCGLLIVSKQVIMANYEMPDPTFAQAQSDKLKGKIFIPSLVIAFGAIIFATVLSDYASASLFSICAAAVLALIVLMALTKAKPSEVLNDGGRLFQQMGPTSMLPQLLAALGIIFTQAGVGEVISNMMGGIVPENNILVGVTVYVLSMAIFTMIMGNGFAAFSVITAGIGIPFVYSQGADPAIAGALALTAGYCGTLLTPMAANFNIVPAALLETKSQYTVIKHQAPMAIMLLIIHIILMYVLAF